jgi:cell shape-determining protein MreD
MNAFPLLLLLAAAFAVVLVQSAFDLTRWLCGAQLNLLPALMVYAALTCELPALVIVALLAGLLFDSVSANPLGTMVAALFLPAWFIYLKRGLILRELPFARFVLGLAATGATPLIALLILLSARAELVLGWFSLAQWAVLTVIGGLLTPLLFTALDATRNALSYQHAPATSFRPDREIRRRRRL